MLSDPVIVCPSCKAEIKLTESLAAPLLATTKQQYEQQLAAKEKECSDRETVLEEQKLQLKKAQLSLDTQIEEKLKVERAAIALEEGKKAVTEKVHQLTEQAKDFMERRRLPYEQLGKIRREFAEKREFPTGDDSVLYLANQTLEAFMHSRSIDEVFGDDSEMRKKMAAVLKKHMQVDADIDREVRRRIKNLEEGTQAWDVEYGKVLEQIKAKHGLKD